MNGVTFLLTDHQLAARLVVALFTLRRWYSGPITVFTTKADSHRIGGMIAEDGRLRVDHEQIDQVEDASRYTSAYLTKATILMSSPYTSTVFLDADTMVVGPIDEVIDRAQCGDITVTPYGRWTTLNDQFQERLEGWEKTIHESNYSEDWGSLVSSAKDRPQPWINAGVLGIRAGHPVIRDWYDLTMLGRVLPMPEESALQLLLHKYPYRLLGNQFNCLPQIEPYPPDVRIWHFAGESHLRYSGGRRLWCPAFDECRRLNIAGVRDWAKLHVPRDLSSLGEPDCQQDIEVRIPPAVLD